jgi:hypothetical protein
MKGGTMSSVSFGYLTGICHMIVLLMRMIGQYMASAVILEKMFPGLDLRYYGGCSICMG